MYDGVSQLVSGHLVGVLVGIERGLVQLEPLGLLSPLDGHRDAGLVWGLGSLITSERHRGLLSACRVGLGR